MKQTVTKSAETFANIAIIAAALLGCIVFIRILLQKAPSPVIPGIHRLSIGSQIPLQGANWSSSEETLLLAISAECRFCSESADFYKNIVAKAGESQKVRVIALLPQEKTVAIKYLNKLGVRIETVLTSSLSSLGILGTPTLLLVDNKGVVKKVWMGRLSASREAEVLNELK